MMYARVEGLPFPRPLRAIEIFAISYPPFLLLSFVVSLSFIPFFPCGRKRVSRTLCFTFFCPFLCIFIQPCLPQAWKGCPPKTTKGWYACIRSVPSLFPLNNSLRFPAISLSFLSSARKTVEQVPSSYLSLPSCFLSLPFSFVFAAPRRPFLETTNLAC